MLHISEQTAVKVIAAGGNHCDLTSDHEPGVGRREETKVATKKTASTRKNCLQLRPTGGDEVVAIVLICDAANAPDQ
jgi:hypothetical protein